MPKGSAELTAARREEIMDVCESLYRTMNFKDITLKEIRRKNRMGKKLVAYFSASGVTSKVAAKLASAAGAVLFEIVPEQPYTSADLNYMNKDSRSSKEMNDKSCRPAISSKVENMADYDVVFIGFPVWWYREPSIIDTFMESYDFAGKTIVPFCTSGGSGLGPAGDNMLALAPGAKLGAGKRFSSGASENELAKWADNFN